MKTPARDEVRSRAVGGELEQQEVKRAHEYLEPLAARLTARSLTVNLRVVADERPVNAILKDGAAHDVDLIAFATRGRGGLSRIVLGSVADKVLRGADIAVLTYRPLGLGPPERPAGTN